MTKQEPRIAAREFELFYSEYGTAIINGGENICEDERVRVIEYSALDYMQSANDDLKLDYALLQKRCEELEASGTIKQRMRLCEENSALKHKCAELERTTVPLSELNNLIKTLDKYSQYSNAIGETAKLAIKDFNMWKADLNK